jgi:hypothetical protein
MNKMHESMNNILNSIEFDNNIYDVDVKQFIRDYKLENILKDENDFRELPNAENVLEVCLRVMTDKFRIMGFTELLTTFSKLLHVAITPNENKLNYTPYIKYIYNRHPFIQITSKPISTENVRITIPLKCSPSHEIQLDILYLNQHF